MSARLLAAAVAMAGALAQQQQTNTRADWPCGARLDSSYFQVAEGTGGQMLLLAPSEILGFTDLSLAFDRHPATIFRLAGTINRGLHDFHVPIDSSVESAMFSIAVQCLQTAEVLRPSGPAAVGDGVTDLFNFLATRMVIVTKPEPGVWTLRVSGSGVAGVMVKARTTIQIASVEFAPAGTTTFRNVPAPGVENIVRIRIRGHLGRVEGAIEDAAAKTIAPLVLEGGGEDGVYQSRFTPGAAGFRVRISGTADDGTRVQRVDAPLFSAR